MTTQDAVRPAVADRPVGDVEDAWSGWVDAARAAGEPSVAVALVERRPRRGADPLADDAAWLADPMTHVAGALTARVTEAHVAGRARRARGLGGVVDAGAERLLQVGGAAAVRDVAEQLARRGDRAGARLLLRAAAVRTPDSAAALAALRSVTPRRVRLWPLAAGAAVALAGAAWVTFVVTTGASAPAISKLTLVVAHVALPLVLRSIREPGFTTAETRVWRRLCEQVYDRELDGPGPLQGRRSGWYGVAGMLGAGLGLALSIGVVVPLVVERTGDATWTGSDDAFFLHLAAVVLGATLGAVLTRSVTRRLVRRRHDRRAAFARLLEAQVDATCRCPDERLLVGRAATGYATHHLAPVGLAAPLPGAVVRRCPRTGTWWLTGPVGSWARDLALRG